MNYKDQILQVLSQKELPCDVEKIRVAVGIGNWNTALHHLLELYIDGKISGQKTSKSWVFWIKRRQ
jgi:hypothetical protein